MFSAGLPRTAKVTRASRMSPATAGEPSDRRAARPETSGLVRTRPFWKILVGFVAIKV